MKISLLTITLLSTIGSFAQSKKWQFYWPDGKVFNTVQNTIAAHKDSLELDVTHDFSHQGDVIIFYPLSNKVAFYITDNKTSLSSLLKLYNHKAYLNSPSGFEMDLKEMLEKGTLDTTYCMWSLGKPSAVVPQPEGTVNWLYKNIDLSLTFRNDRATKYERTPFSGIAKHNLYVHNFKVNGNEYTTGFSISVANRAKKVIKYAWVTVTAFNAVDDPVGTKTVQGVGPVSPGEDGEWTFERVIYSKVVDYLRITGLKVQYMDGTQKLIPKSEIQSVVIKETE